MFGQIADAANGNARKRTDTSAGLYSSSDEDGTEPKSKNNKDKGSSPSKFTFDFKGKRIAVKEPKLIDRRIVNPEIFIDNLDVSGRKRTGNSNRTISALSHKKNHSMDAAFNP